MCGRGNMSMTTRIVVNTGLLTHTLIYPLFSMVRSYSFFRKVSQIFTPQNSLSSLRLMCSDIPAKKIRLNMKIGTHNGTFHCDEVLAVWMLRQTKQFRDAIIIRTRDPESLAECDIVVDVGAIFDHSSLRYDHHQREFKETYNSLDPGKPWTTKLSSAGLVYVYYRKEVIKNTMEIIAAQNGSKGEISDDEVEVIADKVYENLIEEIDGVDNGISAFDGIPRYKVTTTLSQRVGNLNPSWNDESSEEISMKKFEQAMELVSAEFVDRVSYYQLSWLPASSLVREAVEKRLQTHVSGEIICFTGMTGPWKEHIMVIEEELSVPGTIKYVLYKDWTNEKWRIQCVPLRPDSFENRLTLPAEWLGLRDEKLSEFTSIPGCVFVHINGFIGGNETYEGALKMATESLRIANEK